MCSKLESDVSEKALRAEVAGVTAHVFQRKGVDVSHELADFIDMAQSRDKRFKSG